MRVTEKYVLEKLFQFGETVLAYWVVNAQIVFRLLFLGRRRGGWMLNIEGFPLERSLNAGWRWSRVFDTMFTGPWNGIWVWSNGEAMEPSLELEVRWGSINGNTRAKPSHTLSLDCSLSSFSSVYSSSLLELSSDSSATCLNSGNFWWTFSAACLRATMAKSSSLSSSMASSPSQTTVWNFYSEYEH